ncbi:ribonuclease P protein component [Candidatus Shapirobacteria bacterium]|nr:ribonuclease P protein component [Candidatus Shapirobacteria bacterium]
MLKKINRGLTKKDFASILGGGKTIQTPLFGVRYIKSEETKYGWIVSKKISKKAVDRNKIKRRLAEVIAKKILQNVHLVVLVKKSILAAKIIEIKQCWNGIYEKVSSKNNFLV